MLHSAAGMALPIPDCWRSMLTGQDGSPLIRTMQRP